MHKKRINAVALIVRNPESKIIILRELQDKPEFGKRAGMFSIPMETNDPCESDTSALARLIVEELPGLDTNIQIDPRRFGTYLIPPSACVSLYIASALNSFLPKTFFDIQEVGEHRWSSPKEALALWLRPGAREMITDYIAGEIGITRVCEGSRA